MHPRRPHMFLSAGRKERPLAWLGPLNSLCTLDLSGTKSSGGVTTADVAAVAGLAALTSLVMPSRGQRLARNPAQLRQLYEAVGSLRHLARLDLRGAPLGAAALAGLAGSPVTSLRAGDLGAGISGPLPPGLVELTLTSSQTVEALAGLAPAPASLRFIHAGPSPHSNICMTHSSSMLANGGPGVAVVQLHDPTAVLVPAAVALLAGRLDYRTSEWLQVSAWREPPLLGEPPRSLAGGRLGHAAWLQHVGPLRCSHLWLADLALAPGDLSALAAALPRLEVQWVHRACILRRLWVGGLVNVC